MGTGIGHYVPIIAYLGFWVMTFVSLTGKPLYGLYYAIPFLPYRTLRDHFLDYPLGGNVLTILLAAIVIGGLIYGQRLPKTKLYAIWLGFGLYMYVSMWIGTALGNAPAPLWLSDVNFVTWKDYMTIPLVFLAAGLVIQDRKAIRNVVLITACAMVAIDRSCLLDSLSHSWANFDENKRSGGPLSYGSNQTAAFLAQFAMFFWGFGHILKRIKVKLICYGIVALTITATMYTFSRGAYLALLISVAVLGLIKDRKLLIVLGVFLFTWQVVVPTAVTERVKMTKSSDGKLEDSARERVDLWTAAQDQFLSSPIVGMGYATFQMGTHTDSLKDTHNWYVKVAVETGVIGLAFAFLLIQQMLSLSYRLFRRATDPLYKGLGLGLLLAVISCAVANFFGDRWTYLEIMGMLWVLLSAAARALQLSIAENPTEEEAAEAQMEMVPHGA